MCVCVCVCARERECVCERVCGCDSRGWEGGGEGQQWNHLLLPPQDSLSQTELSAAKNTKTHKKHTKCVCIVH